MYKVNDYVMYNHNVCKVSKIKRNYMNGSDYYILTPISDESLVISLPTENKLGLIKDVLSKTDALKLIDNIKNIDPLPNLNDKIIENEYKKLLKNYTHEDLIKVIKTCYLRNKERIDNGKKISEKDKAYFEETEKFLYNELSVSLNKTYEEIRNLIYDKCK